MKALLAALALLIPISAKAGEALAAVATNFLTTAEALATAFEAETGHSITLASGATGTLYAQITRGAPYDLFLAADEDRPARLHDEGRASEPQTYAIGTLTLWSADPARVTGARSVTNTPPRRFAIANPELAPYGRAAAEVITALGWDDTLQGKIVRGENVGQAFAMIASGNAELGLIATSALATNDHGGSAWPVSPEHHAPIRQDVAVTTRGAQNPAATAFADFLTSDTAKAIIAAHGYETP